MGEDSHADGGSAGQRCDHCGALLMEVVTACPFCGARMLNLVSLEEETRAFLAATELRLTEAIVSYPDGLMVPALFGFLVSGPACYLILDSHTEVGLLGRIGFAVLAWFIALLLFGWQASLRDARARKHVWQTVVQPAVRGYLGRKGYSDTEFMAQVRQLLADDSQLRAMLLLRLDESARE